MWQQQKIIKICGGTLTMCILTFAAMGQNQDAKKKLYGIYATFGYCALNYIDNQGYHWNHNAYSSYDQYYVLDLINNQRTIEIGLKVNQKLAVFFSDNKHRAIKGTTFSVTQPTVNLIGRTNYFRNIGVCYNFMYNKLEITPTLGYSFRNYTEFHEFLVPNPVSNVGSFDQYKFMNHGISTGVKLFYPILKFLYLTSSLEYNAYVLSDNDKEIAKNSNTRSIRPNFDFFYDSYQPNWQHATFTVGLNCRFGF